MHGLRHEQLPARHGAECVFDVSNQQRQSNWQCIDHRVPVYTRAREVQHYLSFMWPWFLQGCNGELIMYIVRGRADFAIRKHERERMYTVRTRAISRSQFQTQAVCIVSLDNKFCLGINPCHYMPMQPRFHRRGGSNARGNSV